MRKHSPEERGTEILERVEDLQQEGVSASRSSSAGAKLGKVSFKKAHSFIGFFINKPISGCLQNLTQMLLFSQDEKKTFL